ncbi:MAG: hypothetical protein LBD58_07355 [Treponema sp.]|jgi:hypothetical protein|nr:hypothetical protein [Treponema sp.]
MATRKNVLIIIPFLLVGGMAFSQTDYFFVLGGTANGNRTLPVFYMSLASIVRENDTVSVIRSSGVPTLVCPPVAGNTPHIASILPIFPSALNEEDSAAALSLADEQAAAYGRQGASRALVVISSDQNDAPLAHPASFTDIYYIAVDSPLNPALTAIANPGCSWEINAGALADALSGFITHLAPRYKKSALDNDVGVLSIGGFFHKTKRAALLVENGAAGQTAITKNRIPVSFDVTQIDDYSVVVLNDPAGGKYDVGNGKTLVAVEWNELSPVVFIAAGSTFAFIVALLIIAVFSAAARNKRLRKPAYKVVVCDEDGGPLGKSVLLAVLAVKEFPGKKPQFKSGDSVFQLCEAMKLAVNTEDLKEMLKKDENDAVIAGQTFIKWDKKKDAWFLEYPDFSTDVIKKNGGAKKGDKLFEAEETQLLFTKL